MAKHLVDPDLRAFLNERAIDVDEDEFHKIALCAWRDAIPAGTTLYAKWHELPAHLQFDGPALKSSLLLKKDWQHTKTILGLCQAGACLISAYFPGTLPLRSISMLVFVLLPILFLR